MLLKNMYINYKVTFLEGGQYVTNLNIDVAEDEYIYSDKVINLIKEKLSISKFNIKEIKLEKTKLY